MCNNNNNGSDYGHHCRSDKLTENGFHFEKAALPASSATFCGNAGELCDNNNVTSNSNSQCQSNQIKRNSAPTHMRSKSMPKLLKSQSLTHGNGNGSIALQHQQSLGGRQSGFKCVCCESITEEQKKQKRRSILLPFSFRLDFKIHEKPHKIQRHSLKLSYSSYD